MGHSLCDEEIAGVLAVSDSEKGQEETNRSHFQTVDLHTGWHNHNQQTYHCNYKIREHEHPSSDVISNQSHDEVADHVTEVHKCCHQWYYSAESFASEVAKFIWKCFESWFGAVKQFLVIILVASLEVVEGADVPGTLEAEFLLLGAAIGILVEEIGNNEHESTRKIADGAHQNYYYCLIGTLQSGSFHNRHEHHCFVVPWAALTQVFIS